MTIIHVVASCALSVLQSEAGDNALLKPGSYSIRPLLESETARYIATSQCRDAYLARTVFDASIVESADSLGPTRSYVRRWYRRNDLTAVQVREADMTREIHLVQGGRTRSLTYSSELRSFKEVRSRGNHPQVRTLYSLEGAGLWILGFPAQEAFVERELHPWTTDWDKGDGSALIFLSFSSAISPPESDLVAVYRLATESFLIERVALLSQYVGSSDIGSRGVIVLNGVPFVSWSESTVTDAVQIGRSPFQMPARVMIRETPAPFPCPIFEGTERSVSVTLQPESARFGFAVGSPEQELDLPESYVYRDSLTSVYVMEGGNVPVEGVRGAIASNVNELVERIYSTAGIDTGFELASAHASDLRAAPCGVQAAALCCLAADPGLPPGFWRSSDVDLNDSWMSVQEVWNLLDRHGNVEAYDLTRTALPANFNGVILLSADSMAYDENHFVFAKSGGADVELFDPLLGHRLVSLPQLSEYTLVGLGLATPAPTLGQGSVLALSALVVGVLGIALFARRRSGLAVGFLCSLVTIPSCGPTTSSPQRNSSNGAPGLLATDLVDLGLLSPDKEYSAAFQFTNTTAARIAGLHASSSCGCTRVELDTESLLPGEVLTISCGFELPASTTRTSEVILFQEGSSAPIASFLIVGRTIDDSSWAVRPEAPRVTFVRGTDSQYLEMELRITHLGAPPQLEMACSMGVSAFADEPTVQRSPYSKYFVAKYPLVVVVDPEIETALSSGESPLVQVVPVTEAGTLDEIGISIDVTVVDPVALYPEIVAASSSTETINFAVGISHSSFEISSIVSVLVNSSRAEILYQDDYRIEVEAKATDTLDEHVPVSVLFADGNRLDKTLRIERPVAFLRRPPGDNEEISGHGPGSAKGRDSDVNHQRD